METCDQKFIITYYYVVRKCISFSHQWRSCIRINLFNSGMGKTAFEALVARNYPVVYTIVMFSAILTLVGYLVADILYAIVDPRISYNKK